MAKAKIFKVPDGLTPTQEFYHIANKLLKSPKLGDGRAKLIGDGVTIREMETTIVIKRIPPKGSVEKLYCCAKCNVEVGSKSVKKLWHNYGGDAKSINFCSEECRSGYAEMFPANRVAKSKRKSWFM